MSKAFFVSTLNWNHTKNTVLLDCMENVESKGNHGQMLCNVERAGWDQLVQRQTFFLWFQRDYKISLYFKGLVYSVRLKDLIKVVVSIRFSWDAVE